MTWICVADDDPQVSEALSEALRRAGYEVRSFLDASDALEGIEQAETLPAAAVVDLVMPHLSGQELIERLRANPITAGVPVVVLTGLDLGAAERAALPVQAILEKPVRVEDLVAKLAEAISHESGQP